MSHFWVTFADRVSATVNAKTKDEARAIAETHGKVIELRQLPYPRDPQINFDGCPSFCFGRDECLDNTSCPRKRACDD